MDWKCLAACAVPRSMQRKRLEKRERKKWFGSTADFSLRFSLFLRCNALDVPGSLCPGSMQRKRLEKRERKRWFGSTADFSLRFSLLLRCNGLEVPGSSCPGSMQRKRLGCVLQQKIIGQLRSEATEPHECFATRREDQLAFAFANGAQYRTGY